MNSLQREIDELEAEAASLHRRLRQIDQLLAQLDAEVLRGERLEKQEREERRA